MQHRIPCRRHKMRVVAFVMVVCLCNVFEQTCNAGEKVFESFEGSTWGLWSFTGKAFGTGPVPGTLPGQMRVSGFLDRKLVNSFHFGDKSVGTLTSPEFSITHDYIAFQIGGGDSSEVGIELLVDGKRVRHATGHESEKVRWHAWKVADIKSPVRIRIFDRAKGGWGHVLVDHIVQTDKPPRELKVGRLSDYRKSKTYYRERFRPQFHFTPEINWMNDPNGLVWHAGEFHLFYQHNPHANEWGHMSWGHAVSSDAVHWKHLPIAIHEEYGVMAFSGSAVVDPKNSSGFGLGKESPLVAIFTGHGHNRQTQDLAYSNDRGRTWTTYRDNPVLDIGEKDFRDPKVFWHAPSKRWVMVVALAAAKKLQFYSSNNLKDWTRLSEFGPAGVKNKSNWECPDLFELPIENEPGTTRWVLEADMGNGSVAGGSGGEYFVGTFDGEKFVADQQESRWVDYGRDFYAPVSWSNIPESDGRRLWIGWMNNWQTALNPTFPWRSAMSIPRELKLRRFGEALLLVQKPIRELESLRGKEFSLAPQELAAGKSLDLTNSISQEQTDAFQPFEMDIKFTATKGATLRLSVLKNEKHATSIVCDTNKGTVAVDRRKAGGPQFDERFPGIHTGPLRPMGKGRYRLRVFVDSSSVEVFANHGETVITDLVFPDEDAPNVELTVQGGDVKIEELRVWPLKSIWHSPTR